MLGAKTATHVPEKAFQQAVRDLARCHGWFTYCVWDSRHSPAGWPDLVLLRPPRMIIAELKSGKGRITPEQATCLAALKECGVQTYLWRPSDWDEIAEVLK